MSEVTLESQLFSIINDKEMQEHIKIAKLDMLISLGVDVNTKHKGRSALIIANECGVEGVSEFLRQKGAIEDQLSEEEISKLSKEMIDECCKEDCDINVVRDLIELGANIDARDDVNETALSKICWTGNKDVAELLIREGADVNTQGNYWFTPLIWAADKDCVEIVELLLDNGANPNMSLQNGETALLRAAAYGRKEIVDLLIKKGGDINKRDFNFGDTPLTKAASYGRVDIVDSLVSNGAWIELGDCYGRTPLIKAVEEGYKNVVEYLIEKGADVNAETYDGETVWMIASWNNKKEILEVLIEKGAKIDLEKYYQKKAKITYAKDSETRKMLVDAVKQRNKKEKGLIIGSIKNLFER